MLTTLYTLCYILYNANGKQSEAKLKASVKRANCSKTADGKQGEGKLQYSLKRDYTERVLHSGNEKLHDTICCSKTL